jgi:hypothetical protein
VRRFCLQKTDQFEDVHNNWMFLRRLLFLAVFFPVLSRQNKAVAVGHFDFLLLIFFKCQKFVFIVVGLSIAAGCVVGVGFDGNAVVVILFVLLLFRKVNLK